jgi:hypothetical protein
VTPDAAVLTSSFAAGIRQTTGVAGR